MKWHSMSKLPRDRTVTRDAARRSAAGDRDQGGADVEDVDERGHGAGEQEQQARRAAGRSAAASPGSAARPAWSACRRRRRRRAGATAASTKAQTFTASSARDDAHRRESRTRTDSRDQSSRPTAQPGTRQRAPGQTRGPAGPPLAKGGVTRGRATRHPSVTSVVVRPRRCWPWPGLLARPSSLAAAFFVAVAFLAVVLAGVFLAAGFLVADFFTGRLLLDGLSAATLARSRRTTVDLRRRLAHRGDGLDAVLADGGDDLLAAVDEVGVGLGELGDGVVDLALDLAREAPGRPSAARPRGPRTWPARPWRPSSARRRGR